ncbi:hypothetical protein FQA47_008441 [Oryzias melastigma]|uniref:Uncharacterized protein n=1 Tax=Oryzias melastigma TaxID=30732 RepID=A0A834FA38_ORYME|nr:hypothetical protein FQA47_008441 [Oryzias melastigma]
MAAPALFDEERSSRGSHQFRGEVEGTRRDPETATNKRRRGVGDPEENEEDCPCPCVIPPQTGALCVV